MTELAAVLEEEVKKINHLTVFGIGVVEQSREDHFVVYCRAKHNAAQRIPKVFEGYPVKYMFTKGVIPAKNGQSQ